MVPPTSPADGLPLVARSTKDRGSRVQVALSTVRLQELRCILHWPQLINVQCCMAKQVGGPLFWPQVGQTTTAKWSVSLDIVVG